MKLASRDISELVEILGLKEEPFGVYYTETRPVEGFSPKPADLPDRAKEAAGRGRLGRCFPEFLLRHRTHLEGPQKKRPRPTSTPDSSGAWAEPLPWVSSNPSATPSSTMSPRACRGQFRRGMLHRLPGGNWTASSPTWTPGQLRPGGACSNPCPCLNPRRSRSWWSSSPGPRFWPGSTSWPPL